MCKMDTSFWCVLDITFMQFICLFNKLKVNMNQNMRLLIQENAYENIVC